MRQLHPLLFGFNGLVGKQSVYDLELPGMSDCNDREENDTEEVNEAVDVSRNTAGATLLSDDGAVVCDDAGFSTAGACARLRTMTAQRMTARSVWVKSLRVMVSHASKCTSKNGASFAAQKKEPRYVILANNDPKRECGR